MNRPSMIKKLRNQMLLIQTEFAVIIGVSFASVNRWENGQYEPTMKIKRKLMKMFKKYIVVED